MKILQRTKVSRSKINNTKVGTIVRENTGDLKLSFHPQRQPPTISCVKQAEVATVITIVNNTC